MKTSKFTEEQIAFALRQAETGTRVTSGTASWYAAGWSWSAIVSGRTPFCFDRSFVLNLKIMSEEKGKVVAVTCPCCQSLLWVEPSTGSVVKSERAAKKKESLDDLLLKEKKKKDGFATKFEATADLEKKKFETAKAKFEKAFEKLDDE